MPFVPVDYQYCSSFDWITLEADAFVTCDHMAGPRACPEITIPLIGQTLTSAVNRLLNMKVTCFVTGAVLCRSLFIDYLVTLRPSNMLIR